MSIHVEMPARADFSDEQLAFIREMGISYLNLNISLEECREDFLLPLVKRLEGYGLKISDLACPPLQKNADIILGRAGRDRAIARFQELVRMAGGVPVVIETKAENKFRLTPEEIEEKITPRTKLLVLPFPNNPTGAVMRREDLEAVAEVVKKHNLLVLSDEIYSALTYGDQLHVSFASIDDMAERTIVVNGFSKAFAMTGWRLGYAVGPKEIIAQMTKLHQYGIMSAPTTAQYAAIEAMRNGDSDIQYMRSQYDMRRRLIVDGFNKMGLTCFEPEGAFYVFPCIRSTGLSSEDFCEQLIYKEHVAVVPGPAFGACGEGFVRVSYSYSIRHITEALHRIEHFLEELRA